MFLLKAAVWPRADKTVKERRPITAMAFLEGDPADEAKALRAEANTLLPGRKRDALLRKARRAETASRLHDWLASPGLRPPE
jgi:hypothetical protein